MEFSKIFKHLEKKIRESNEYKKDVIFFTNNNSESNILALDFITTHCKKQKNFDIDNLNCCHHTEEAITQFIVERKQEFEQEEKFHTDFVRYIIRYKPIAFELLINLVRDYTTNNCETKTYPDDLPQHEISAIVRFHTGLFVKSLKPKDIFMIITSDNSETEIIDFLAESNSDFSLQLLAYKKKLKEFQPKHESQIINKKYLILLLDFCNEFLKNNPKAKAEKIIKAFEDEKKYCGAWKTWGPFFNNYSDLIKELTNIRFNKKIDAIFAINKRRDQIDNLFSTIDYHKKL